MAHYPLYTQNLSLVGVCVKRIGKVQTFVEVVEGCPVDVSQDLRAGSKFVAGISYPARFPTRFESNAYIWQPNHDFTTVRS